MPYIPIKQLQDDFKPLFPEGFNEDQVELIKNLNENLLFLAKTLNYTIDNGQGFLLIKAKE